MNIRDFLEDHPLARHILYMIGASLVIIFLAFMLIKIVARQGKEYELPDFRGITLTNMIKYNPYHLRYVVIDSVYDADQEGGIVIQQDPKPGTMIKTRRKVYVTVTTFAPSDVVLPELSNMTVRSAVSALEAAGLRCGKLRFVESPYRNMILECKCKGKMVYAGEKMAAGDVVDLYVGLGEGNAGTRVPFVIGQAPAKARRGILSASMNVGTEHFEGVTDRSSAVCYRLNPDYTGVTRYPLGTYVEIWYCDATEADVERIISNFQVDSSLIFENEYDDYEYDTYSSDPTPDFDDGWDW
ncbi:MAG: PASTA domain-containing protein [Bacteroidales bacterium]|nr:PASTA domain-containing protein [Candidatus Colimorpha merdihippi]MCQ2281587.1 PASTA domain-containing protein [Bacteroidales bacterium]